LYRAFAHARGITAYIRKRRLEVIHALLKATTEGLSIGEIARQYGFVSAAHPRATVPSLFRRPQRRPMRSQCFAIGKNSCVEAFYRGSNLRFEWLHKNGAASVSANSPNIPTAARPLKS
jgi:hypothetical protein